MTDYYFVKTGIFEKQLSTIAHTAFDSRQVHDYQDFQTLTYEQAKTQFDEATRFIHAIEHQQGLLMQGKIPLPKVS